MKKLIVGLMGLMLMVAMALPVAAQGRSWNRDNQTTNFDRRDNRYEMERRRQNEYDNFNRRNTWQHNDRREVRGIGTLLRLVIRR